MWGDETIKRSGLYLIAPDRPGIGRSDPQPNRSFSDYVKDVEFLAGALGWNKFSTLGVSGGGGYGVACAAKIPNRLHTVVMASGAWQADAIKHFPIAQRLAWRLAQRFPLINLLTLKLELQSLNDSAERRLAKMKKRVSPVDYDFVESQNRVETVRQMSAESMCQGLKGVAWDTQLYLKEWDFNVDKIQMPLTFLHGEQDITIPIAVAKQVAASLPTAQLTTYPAEGHLTLIANQFETIASKLIVK
ncbi:hydrolase, alpha/beta fold family, putative [Synechococcus sp. PCC 7335]|nr:hydrolase, alpha/beta fold family, putative [Synechococcus sp. PCC 7335]